MRHNLRIADAMHLKRVFLDKFGFPLGFAEGNIFNEEPGEGCDFDGFTAEQFTFLKEYMADAAKPLLNRKGPSRTR